MKVCQVDKCFKKHVAKGFCGMHYQRVNNGRNVGDEKVQLARHGLRKNPTYNSWRGMKERCSNPKNKAFKHYGARGIKVCKEWEESFETFYDDMGERPDGMSLERIDIDSNYCFENCKWATVVEQRNNMSTNINITYDDRTQTLKQWCVELNLNYQLVRRRYHDGWTIEKAFFKPTRKTSRVYE